MATAAELQIARAWVGSTPDDTELGTLIDGMDTAELAALDVLKRRHADMLTAPTRWTAVGDYTQDTTANLTVLAAQIRSLEAVTGTGPGANGQTPGLATIGVGDLRRTNRPRLYSRP